MWIDDARERRALLSKMRLAFTRGVQVERSVQAQGEEGAPNADGSSRTSRHAIGDRHDEQHRSGDSFNLEEPRASQGGLTSGTGCANKQTINLNIFFVADRSTIGCNLIKFF
jgi:hypothetical protein